jgi:hypothetical protein
MRAETVFRVTNFRYHPNPSSDRVCFRRRCNDLTFPWRAAHSRTGEWDERDRTRRDPGNGAFGGSDIEGKAAMGSGE